MLKTKFMNRAGFTLYHSYNRISGRSPHSIGNGFKMALRQPRHMTANPAYKIWASSARLLHKSYSYTLLRLIPRLIRPFNKNPCSDYAKHTELPGEGGLSYVNLQALIEPQLSLLDLRLPTFCLLLYNYTL